MKIPAYKSGRAWNGAHRDAGTIVHLVEEMPENCGGYWGEKALCGAEPGRRGNGWAVATKPVSCQKCINRNNSTTPSHKVKAR